MFKMTWALVARHADEWTGDNFDQAAAVLNEKVEAVVAQMRPEIQDHFREEFLTPVRDGIGREGRAAVEAGRPWDDAAGPLLVVLTPAA
ncbi:hypothetical protein ACPCAA_17590 [Streptomyces griseoincarnatus]